MDDFAKSMASLYPGKFLILSSGRFHGMKAKDGSRICHNWGMKTISKIEWISGTLFLLLALGCFFFPIRYAAAFFYICAGLASASSLGFVYEGFRQKRGSYWLMALITGVAAGFLWFHTRYSHELIGLVFSLYILLNCVVEGIQTVLDYHEKARDFKEHLLMTLVYFGLFVVSVAARRMDIRFIIYYFGIYLLIQAFEAYAELYVIRHPHSSRTYSFNHWVALPVYVVTLLPFWILSSMNRRLMKEGLDSLHYDERKNDEPVNLRVFIHSGLEGDHRVGHMTFSWKGIMYSYGNYDKAEERLFRTIGPGIFFRAPANIYVNNCCIYEESTLFEFGLHLNEEQEEKLQGIINHIMETTTRWDCPIEQANRGWEHFEEYESDYASRLHYRTGAKFRKFTRGQYKTYWVMGDNCSLFAENILSSLDHQIVHKSGIVTPGEYFEYFQEAFADPRSNVVYRSWHSASVPYTLYPTLS